MPEVFADVSMKTSPRLTTTHNAEENTNNNPPPRVHSTCRAPQGDEFSLPAAVILSEERLVNESLPVLSPTLFLSEKARPLSSINPDEPIKVKILLTSLADKELGFQSILKSVPDSLEDLPLQASKIIHNTIPRGEDSILQFLSLSKDHSDIKKIDLASPTAPVEDSPIILLKTLSSDDIQEMSGFVE